ncbi:uncharacterized protein LOC130762015 isoform X2 [Actinidia eriantha]|uniref:uncharacterized protein LOC130762015 isoform X2 n=1 Tax=Actinidia eriantha TaxID=165200 RepID=UPI00258F17B4|nr:uncharacterized protein LOC130762015 isoform X2 [Actinidia eriantha]
MAQEEHNQRGSNSNNSGGRGGGGGNRSSKKLKQKKVPQRGLGVAQLEKIRLEEQQKKDDAILSPNSLLSPSNSSSCLAVQCVSNFRHNPSPSSIPVPPPPPINLSPPNPIFRPSSSIPNIDFLHPNSVPLLIPSNDGGGEIAISGLGQANWHKFWNGDYNLEGESHRLDHPGFEFQSNMNNAPYESNPIWPPPNLIQKAQLFQQQPSSSSMVNVSSGTSSSSMINYHQMEPPSNQSFYGNNNTHRWPEEEKMVGLKRPYPFSLDNPPGHSFPCKFPPTYVPVVSRSDESASCGNGGTLSLEPINPIFREGPSSSTVMSELNPKKVAKQNGDLNGDFLTLGPPTSTLPQPSSKYKHPSAYPAPPSRELSEFESLPHQGSAEDPMILQPGPSGSTPKQPFYSFFNLEKAQIGNATSTLSGSNGGGEQLDLNLKL